MHVFLKRSRQRPQSGEPPGRRKLQLRHEDAAAAGSTNSARCDHPPGTIYSATAMLITSQAIIADSSRPFS